MAGSRFNFSDAEKDAQRRVTWQYAAIAQGSTLTALLAIATVRRFWCSHTARRYRSTAKYRHLRVSGQASRWDKVKWWLSDDIYFYRMSFSRPDEWILTLFWFSWLFFLSVIGKIDEPFSLTRLPQDICDIPWNRLLTLPDAQAFHISNRFGIIAASQWPLLPLLGMKRSSPLAHILGCAHGRLNRYHTVLSGIIFIFFMLHSLIHLVQMDLQTLKSTPVAVRAAIYLGLYFVLSVGQTYVATSRILGLAGLACMVLLVGLVFRHAPVANVFVMQSAVTLLLMFGLETTTRVVLRRQTLLSAQAQAATTPPPTEACNAEPPFIRLRLSISEEKKSDSSTAPKEDESTENSAAPPPAKSITAATLYTRNGLLVRHLTDLWLYASLALRSNASYPSRLQNQHETLIMEYASAATPAREETTTCIRFDGPHSTLNGKMDNLILFDADQVIFIAGGMPGYLAYPAYFAYVTAQRKKHDAGNVRMVWAAYATSGACCAIPRRLLVTDSFQAEGDAMVLCPDTELLNDGDREGTAVQRQAAKRQPCLPGGEPCSHARLGELIDRLLCRNPQGSVAVVVVGPAELDGEARSAIRPWVRRGRKLWWLFEDFGM